MGTTFGTFRVDCNHSRLEANGDAVPMRDQFVRAGSAFYVLNASYCELITQPDGSVLCTKTVVLCGENHEYRLFPAIDIGGVISVQLIFGNNCVCV